MKNSSMVMKKYFNEVIDPITMNKDFRFYYFGFKLKTKAIKLFRFVKQAYHMHSLL